MPVRLSASIIVTACVGVTAAGLAGPARADDRPEVRESAIRWIFDGALVAGHGHGRATYSYRNFDEEPPSSDQGGETGPAPAGAIDLAIAARVSDGLLLGGYVRAGVTLTPNVFTGASEITPFHLVGPRVAWAPAALGGLELRADGGLAYLWPLSVGGRVAIGAGYPVGELAGGTLMLGIEGSGVWALSGEDGDHGRYTYRDRLLGAHLVLGLRR